MVKLVYCLRHLLFFDIPLLLYYYINLKLLRDIYLSLGTCLSYSFVSVLKLFCGDVFQT